MSAELVEFVKRLGSPRVLVVGDIMLDRYVWGNAERVSQEAPVMLLRVDRREERLGGAASVANMLAELGAQVKLAGVVGADAEAARVLKTLADRGVVPSGVFADPSRPTTVKERYMGRAQQRHPQQMMRVDYEVRDAIDANIEQSLLESFDHLIERSDAVLISDYDKGVCTPTLLANLITKCRRRGKPIIADPTRGGDYSKYRNCTAITPNRLEASMASGIEINSTTDALRAANLLRQRLDLDAAIVTLDRDGMALSEAPMHDEVFPTRPRQVYDITGAGDMVLAVLGLAIAVGADFDLAIRLANAAGGLEVEKIGAATITRNELIADLMRSPTRECLCDLPELVYELAERRRRGQRVAFTNGCFDILHAGHVQYLEEARAQADLLIVGLNSDASVRSLKGPDRPLNSVESRAIVLSALRFVDYLFVFDEATPLHAIEQIRPDVLVKGADYHRDQVVGADLVESYGGRVHLAQLRPEFSTSGVIRKIRAA